VRDRKVLITNILSLTGSRYANMAIGFAHFIVLARCLGVKELGVFVTIQTVLFFGGGLQTFGMMPVVIRNVARDHSLAGAYVQSFNFVSVILSLVFSAVTPAVFYWLGFSMDIIVLIAVSCLSLVFISVFTATRALFRAFERMAAIAGVETLFSLIQAAAGIVLLLAGFRLSAMIGLLFIAAAARAVVALWLQKRAFPNLNKRLDLGLCGRMLKEAGPIAVIRIFDMVNRRVDLLMVSAMQSMSAAGFYGVATRAINVSSVPMQSFGEALLPHISVRSAHSMDAVRRTYEKTLEAWMMISFPTAILVTVLAEPVVAIAFGREFLAGGTPDAIRILIWSLCFDALAGPARATLLASDAKMWQCVPWMAGIVGVNVILNLFWIPKWSFIGASYSTLLCSVLGMLASVYIVRTMFVEKPKWLSLVWRPLLASMGMALPMALLHHFNVYLSAAAGAVVYPALLHVLGVRVDPSVFKRRSRKAKSADGPPPDERPGDAAAG